MAAWAGRPQALTAQLRPHRARNSGRRDVRRAAARSGLAAHGGSGMAERQGPPATGHFGGGGMTQITCLDCGVVASRSGGSPKRCLPCATKKRPRLAAQDRVRNGIYSNRVVDGATVCLDCADPIERSGHSRGGPMALRCNTCRSVRGVVRQAIRTAAATAVATAIRRGVLAHASTLKCVDCLRPAEQYDHRDYTKPIEVEPVCRSCNVMRGPADVWCSVETQQKALA